MRSLLRLIAESFDPKSVPSVLGTMRDRTVREATGNSDPCAERKRISNQRALEIVPIAEKIISAERSASMRLRKACLYAIAGNVIEFDIPGHEFAFSDLNRLLQDGEKDLVIDDIAEAYGIVKDSSLIIYLTDNAGEIALDTLFVRELKRTGPKVVVAVKDKPVLNDATLDEARHVGMHEIADSLITTGTDTMGLSLEECSKDFLNYYDSADLVIAKGMAYAETITEIDLASPHLLLLRTKCSNVARYFGVEKNKNVAKLLYGFKKD